MLLYLLRHADTEASAESDEARRLTEKGREQARKVARFLEAHELHLSLVLSSPVRRAHETAQLVVEQMRSELLPAPWLACGMRPETAIEELKAYRSQSSVMLVGPRARFFPSRCPSARASKRDPVSRAQGFTLSLRAHGPPRRCRSPRILNPMPTHVTSLVPTVLRTENLSADAARFIAEQARAAIQARGFFRLGLSGGNTPRAVYAELAQSNEEIAWPKIQITFGDERCVPPDHADSNYRMARESLLDHVLLPAGNIFRIQGELPPERGGSTPITSHDFRLSPRALASLATRTICSCSALGRMAIPPLFFPAHPRSKKPPETSFPRSAPSRRHSESP